MEKPIVYSKHQNFNFEEARCIAKYYANSDEILTMTRAGYWLQYDRRQITRFLKVAIIFQLISKDDADKIIDSKCKVYNKYADTKANAIRTYERCIELAEERVKLINKMEKMLLMFASQNKEQIKETYISRIKEIEKYAFR